MSRHSAESDAPSVARFRERFTTCASCRAEARWLVDGTTTCDRHRPTWERRAREKRATARGIPPAETGHGLPFDPPDADEPTCPICGQALFTHGIVGRCTPPAETDTKS